VLLIVLTMASLTAGSALDSPEDVWLMQPADGAAFVPRNARLLFRGEPPRGALELRAAGTPVAADVARVGELGWTLAPRQPLPAGARCELSLGGRRIARFTTTTTLDQRPPVVRVHGAARRTDHSQTVCNAEGECFDPAYRETCLWYTGAADDHAAPEALVALAYLGRKGESARRLRGMSHVERAGGSCVRLHGEDRGHRLCGRLELLDLAGNRVVSPEVCEPEAGQRRPAD
jgi:hypothetical protein